MASTVSTGSGVKSIRTVVDVVGILRRDEAGIGGVPGAEGRCRRRPRRSGRRGRCARRRRPWRWRGPGSARRRSRPGAPAAARAALSIATRSWTSASSITPVSTDRAANPSRVVGPHRHHQRIAPSPSPAPPCHPSSSDNTVGSSDRANVTAGCQGRGLLDLEHVDQGCGGDGVDVDLSPIGIGAQLSGVEGLLDLHRSRGPASSPDPADTGPKKRSRPGDSVRDHRSTMHPSDSDRSRSIGQGLVTTTARVI